MLHLRALLFLLLPCLFLFRAAGQQSTTPGEAAPLVVGQTFTIASKALGETRRINVYLPAGYAESKDLRLPVLYMPDGGMAEDFLHVAGLVQVSVGNETMRPFLVVGIENTERRRDLTGPTTNPDDRKIAPRVGGSAVFRQFIRQELMPEVKRRYRTTPETAIVGESLAGLFVVETLLKEPDLFDTYLAFDPSLWWNNAQLVKDASRLLETQTTPKTLYIATSNEPQIVADVQRLTETLRTQARPRLTWHYAPMPQETHGTIYHPAALKSFRVVFKLQPNAR